MQVDEAGGDDGSVGVDHPRRRRGIYRADLDDTVAVDRHITAVGLGAGPVDDRAASNHQIVCHVESP